MTKAPTPTEKSEKQRGNTKTPPKTSITQQLRTDLGRSVGVTITTELVWLDTCHTKLIQVPSFVICNLEYKRTDALVKIHLYHDLLAYNLF